MEKQSIRDSERAAIVKKTSRITGVSERSVYRVLAAEQVNETVLRVYMEILEEEEMIENKLLTAVNKLVPFN